MNLESLQAVIREFNTRGVRYVIAGGLAVVGLTAAIGAAVPRFRRYDTRELVSR